MYYYGIQMLHFQVFQSRWFRRIKPVLLRHSNEQVCKRSMFPSVPTETENSHENHLRTIIVTILHIDSRHMLGVKPHDNISLNGYRLCLKSLPIQYGQHSEIVIFVVLLYSTLKYIWVVLLLVTVLLHWII